LSSTRPESIWGAFTELEASRGARMVTAGVMETPPAAWCPWGKRGTWWKARAVILKTIAKSNAEEVDDWGVIKEKIRTTLRKHFDQETSKRPMVLPVILEV
jgi:mRNA degradation ribonuclease J1/J2